MLKFMVTVEAKAGSHVIFESAKPIVGYFQTLGVTARTQGELETLVREYLRKDLDGTLCEISEIWAPDFRTSEKDIRELCEDTEEIGVWYASGHAWFWDDGEEENGEKER